MRLAKHLTLLSALLFLLGCAFGQDVHYNYDFSANFGSYKTYEWVDLPGIGGAVPDQLIDQAIKRAVDEQLSAKGLTRVDKDGDLKIGYHAIIREETGINLNAFGWVGGPRGGWGGWNGGTVTGQTSTIPVGMLAQVTDQCKQVQPLMERLEESRRKEISIKLSGKFDAQEAQALAAEQSGIIQRLIVVNSQLEIKLYSMLTSEQQRKVDGLLRQSLNSGMTLPFAEW